MPTTLLSGITYTEFHEGYRERFSENGHEVVRVLDVAWDDAWAFLKDMLGTAEENADGGIKRTLPEPHPDFEFLWAAEAELLNGVGAPDVSATTDAIVYDYARYSIIYRAPFYEVLADEDVDGTVDGELLRYVHRTSTFAQDALQVNGMFYWPTANLVEIPQPLAEPPTILMPTRELTYTWYHVPRVPEKNIAFCLGKVNEFMWDDNTYPAETLLMTGAQVEPIRSSYGELLYNITYKFLQKDHGRIDGGGVEEHYGHNHLWHPSRGWLRPTRRGLEGKDPTPPQPAGIYELTDFSYLFSLMEF